MPTNVNPFQKALSSGGGRGDGKSLGVGVQP